MGELYFAFKATVMTLIAVFFMQIKVGEHTVEENAYHWLKNHYLVVQLNQVSQGAVIALRETYQGISSSMTAKVKKSFKDEFQPGSRSVVPDLKRSKEYLSEFQEQIKNLDVDKVKGQMQEHHADLQAIQKELDEQGRRSPSSR